MSDAPAPARHRPSPARPAAPHAPRERRSTAIGMAAVAVAALGQLTCAVVVSAPGAAALPPQPGGQAPSGPFAALARAFGITGIGGDARLWAMVVALVVAAGGWVWLLVLTRRGEVSPRAVLGLGVGAQLAVLLLPLLFSRDAYSYAFYGRILSVYGENPYVRTPVDHVGDPLWPLVGSMWIATPAVYGPGFTALAALIAKAFAGIGAQVAAYRAIAVAASVATTFLIRDVVRKTAPDREAFALAAFAAAPTVTLLTAASVHNDLLVALSVAGALALALRGRELPAVAALSLGALVKASAAIPLVLFIVWCAARRPASERARALATRAGLAAGIALVFAVPFLQTHGPTLGMLELAGHEGWLAPSATLRVWVDRLSLNALGVVVRVAFAAAVVGAVVWLARALWRRPAGPAAVATGGPPPTGSPPTVIALRELGAAWGWALVALLLLGPVLLPWYPVWALPLAWLLPREPRRALIATSVLLVVSQWSAEPLRFPDAFRVNVWLNRWLWVPVLLVLLVRSGLDLAARLRAGRALQQEEPVAAAAGER